MTFEIYSKVKNIYILEEPLLIHRIHNESISNTLTVNNTKDFYFAINLVEKIIKENIPNIYSNEQYLFKCKKGMFELILYYLKCNMMKQNEKEEVNVLLKEYISEKMKLVNENKEYIKFTLKEKIIFFLYNNCLWLLNIIYIVHKKIKNIIKY